MANSSYNTLYSTAQYKTIKKMTTALWIDVFCQQSHSWGQPFLWAQPHCNSVKTQKTITWIFTAVNLKQWQRWWRWWVLMNLPTTRTTMNITEKAVRLSSYLYENWCNYTLFSFLPKGHLFSWDTTLTFPPYAIYRQFYPIPRNLKTVIPKFFGPNSETKIKKVQLTDLDDIYEVHFLFNLCL